jgi:hypothetical protein
MINYKEQILKKMFDKIMTQKVKDFSGSNLYGLRFVKDSVRAWDRLRELTGNYYFFQSPSESDEDFVLRAIRSTKIGDKMFWVNPDYIPKEIKVGKNENFFCIDSSYDNEISLFNGKKLNEITDSLPTVPNFEHKPIRKSAVVFTKDVPEGYDWVRHFPHCTSFTTASFTDSLYRLPMNNDRVEIESKLWEEFGHEIFI